MCQTAAAGSRSCGFGLGDQWRFSVDSEIHPPNLDEVPTRKRASKSADLEASLDLNPRFLRRAVCFARTGVSGRSVSVRRNSCVAVREDLLKASSQYVNYIGKPFKLTVEYTFVPASTRPSYVRGQPPPSCSGYLLSPHPPCSSYSPSSSSSSSSPSSSSFSSSSSSSPS